jgi:hypothetical protein
MKLRALFASVLLLALVFQPAAGQETRGTTPLTIPKGGTGASTASGARTNLGLGTMATQNANAVAITGGTVTGLPSPSSTSDAATKQYVDNAATGLTVHTGAALATAAALPTNTYNNGSSGVGATLTATSNSALTVDGSAVSSSQRIVVKNEAASANNGIYVVTNAGSAGAAYVLTRATDANTPGTANPNEIGYGSFVLIAGGSTNIGSGWLVNSIVTTIGTSAISWVQFSSGTGVTSVTCGTGLTGGTFTSTGTCQAVLPPGGRLVAMTSSCTGAPPVQTADIASAGVVCYVPFKSTYLPINGSIYPFSTLTLTLNSANILTGNLYDVFALVNSGSAVICADIVAWASTTARTDGISLSSNGYYANAGTINQCENGSTIYSTVVGGNAIYLGTIYAISNGATQWLLNPNPANGGTNNFMGVYNAYNREPTTALERDLVSTFVYGNPTGTWEKLNNNANNRITIVDGLGQSQVYANATISLSYNTGTDAQAGSPGICPDCTTPGAVVGIEAQGSFTAVDQGGQTSVHGPWSFGLGLHYLQFIISGESAHSDGPIWYCNYSCSEEATLDN